MSDIAAGGLPSGDASTDTSSDSGLRGDDGAVHCGQRKGPCCANSRCDPDLVCLAKQCSCLAELKADEDFACARQAGGRLLCWGANGNGQLGIGKTSSQETRPSVVSSVKDFSGVDLGAFHVCAWNTSGAVWCWGRNDVGQVGRDSPTGDDEPAPVRVPDIDEVVQVASGGFHNCVRKRDRTLWCWGQDSVGQLGDGAAGSYRATPAAVVVSGGDPLTGTDIASGGFHSCAVRPEGTVWCWGYNKDGQLGDGTQQGRAIPQKAKGLTDVAQVTAGDYHTCALTNGGEIYCWGRNNSGQVGSSTITDDRVLRPTKISSSLTFVAVAAGDDHTCAIRDDRTVWCWGRNAAGQLGDGSTDDYRAAPSQLPTITSALQVALGRDHSCALASGDQVYCWGSNRQGQFGNGTTGSSDIPIWVPLPCP